jgi:thioredoxin reductase (NADPH)
MPADRIVMYGTTWCPDCKRAKRFLGQQRVQYDWIDVEQDPQAMRLIEEINQGKQVVPTIRFPDGSALAEPSNADLAEKLGIATKAKRDHYELVVIGGGPAGLTAALYAAREGIDTLVIDRAGLGGQAAVTERLDNFPGFPEGVSGAEFADRLTKQAERFGVEALPAAEVVGCTCDGRYHCIRTKSGEEYGADAVLLAPGSTYRRLKVPGEEDFIGAGVHFCATCDGAFYKGAEQVLVVGGGNSAGEEGLFLTRFAKKVTMVTIDPDLTASDIVARKVKEHPQMEVVFRTTVAEFRGGKRLESVVLKNMDSGETQEVRPAAVFVFIGLQPNTKFLESSVELDKWGFIVTSLTLETNVPGVFAAGDARAGATKQAASAAGEGATAALMIREYLKERSPHGQA